MSDDNKSPEQLKREAEELKIRADEAQKHIDAARAQNQSKDWRDASPEAFRAELKKYGVH